MLCFLKVLGCDMLYASSIIMLIAFEQRGGISFAHCGGSSALCNNSTYSMSVRLINVVKEVAANVKIVREYCGNRLLKEVHFLPTCLDSGVDTVWSEPGVYGWIKVLSAPNLP